MTFLNLTVVFVVKILWENVLFHFCLGKYKNLQVFYENIEILTLELFSNDRIVTIENNCYVTCYVKYVIKYLLRNRSAASEAFLA